MDEVAGTPDTRKGIKYFCSICIEMSSLRLEAADCLILTSLLWLVRAFGTMLNA